MVQRNLNYQALQNEVFAQEFVISIKEKPFTETKKSEMKTCQPENLENVKMF